jgi:hypothetical protein
VSDSIIEDSAISGPGEAASKRTFRPETDRATAEPAAATDFRQRGASSIGDFAPSRQFGGVSVDRKEVIRLELRIIGQNLLL